jgi:spermidine synthase
MPRRLLVVALLLFASGMCALVYQSFWLREFRLVFGGSTMASAAVLAIFMGGLGLGNLWLGPLADRTSRPLQMYALLELVVALSAAVTPGLIGLVRGIYIAAGGQASLGDTGATMVRLLLSTLVLAVPTTLMGATLPAAARAITTQHDQQRSGLGLIYGLNTLGAVLGVVLSTFWMLEQFGGRATLWFACAVNLTIAGCAWLEDRANVPSKRDLSAKRKVTPTPVATERSDVSSAFIYAVSAAVGCAFFLLELAWFRMLTPLLGGSTYTFGLILASALAGIGLGGALYPAVFRERRPTVLDFAATCGLQALVILAPLAWGDDLAIWAGRQMETGRTSFAALMWASSMITAIVVFPTALLSGIQFPILVSLLGSGEAGLGRQVGRAYACNTLGCIAGSLLGGFVFMQLFAAPGVWKIAGVTMAITSLAAAIAHALSRTKGGSLLVPFAAAVLALGMALLPGPTSVWRHSAIGAGRAGLGNLQGNALKKWVHLMRDQDLAEAEGREASLAIRRGTGASFYINGKSDGNAIDDADTQIMLGMVGAILHANPRSALVVGLGTGETAGWLAACDEIERIDCVELEPAVVAMAELCASANHDLLRNPKLRLIFNDAREVLLVGGSKYDLIVSEPSNPYRAGVASLFTSEFYAAAKKRLNPGGTFGQWLQGYEVDVGTVALVFETLGSVFPHVEVWQTGAGDFLLLAGESSEHDHIDRMRKKLTREPYCSAINIACAAHTLEGFCSGYVGGRAFVDRFAAKYGNGAVNTDDLNTLEYAFARSVGNGQMASASLARAVAHDAEDSQPRLVGDFDVEAWRDCCFLRDFRWQAADLEETQGRGRAQNQRVRALIDTSEGRPQRALEHWRKQSKPPSEITELQVLAINMIDVDDPDAIATIEMFAVFRPQEAKVLHASWLDRHDQRAAAAKRLEEVFIAARTTPWIDSETLERGMALAVGIAEADPAFAGDLYLALREPFAVHHLHFERRVSALLVAEQAGPGPLVEAIKVYEPSVMWTERFLAKRAQAYAAANHPLAAQAEADLNEFRSAP